MAERLTPTEGETKELTLLGTRVLNLFRDHSGFVAAISEEKEKRTREFAEFSTEIGLQQVPLLRNEMSFYLRKSKKHNEIPKQIKSELKSQTENLIWVLGNEGILLIHRSPETDRIPSSLKMEQHGRVSNIVGQAILLAANPDMKALTKPNSHRYDQIGEKVLARIEKVKTEFVSYPVYRFYLIFEKYIASPFNPEQQGIVMANCKISPKEIIQKQAIQFVNELNGVSSNMLVLTDGQGISPLV